MPKVLLYITFKITWIFLFWNTDFNENRAHVHVGKKGTERLCKIWLEPDIEVADSGDLSTKQIQQIKEIAEQQKNTLLKQWNQFKKGKSIKIIQVKK